MSKVKAAAGLMVGIGGPALFAVLAISGIVAYHHSGAAIAAVAATIGLAWVVVTILLILFGGSMYADRDRKWA